MSRNQEQRFRVISLRVSADEYTQIQHRAGGIGISAYLRKMALETVEPRRRSFRQPIKDYTALAQILGLLGQSHVANNLNQIAKALNSGSLMVGLETEQNIQEACKAVIQMRDVLMQALGKNTRKKP
jgi:hypothetical protein